MTAEHYIPIHMVGGETWEFDNQVCWGLCQAGDPRGFGVSTNIPCRVFICPMFMLGITRDPSMLNSSP